MPRVLSVSGAASWVRAAGVSILLLFCGAVAAAAATDSCRELSDSDIDELRGREAVVTDIDGVLSGYVLQDYGPTNGAFLDQGVAYPRTDAALMISIYHRNRYVIVYMAGRPRQMQVLGTSMCEATLEWLRVNGFPVDPGNTLLLLRDGSSEIVDADNPGQAMAEWMGEHGTDLMASMVTDVKTVLGLVPRFGYVDSDVVTDAYLAVGVPAEQIFSIGNKGMSRLGYRGTQAIVGPEANPGYTRHIKRYVVPNVPQAK